MPDVVLSYPTQGKDDKETIRNLTDVVYKIQKELDYLLQNLDSKNIKTLTADKIIAGTINLTDGITISSENNKTVIDSNGITMFEGSISWENVNVPTTSQVGAKPYDWLPSYGDISGIKPPTNADNTSSTIGANRLTYIDGNGIYTGTLTANQINVISGIVLGANATIQWASLPSLPTASQVGARPDNWTPNWTDVGGRPNTTYIDANGIYTGTLIAENINGTYLTGKTIRTASTGARMIMDSSGIVTYSGGTTKHGVFANATGTINELLSIYNTGSKVFELDLSNAPSIALRSIAPSYSGNMASFLESYNGVTSAVNTWDFTNATVTGTKKVIVQSTAPTGRSDAIWVKTA